jgi:hypothetical protein
MDVLGLGEEFAGGLSELGGRRTSLQRRRRLRDEPVPVDLAQVAVGVVEVNRALQLGDGRAVY